MTLPSSGTLTTAQVAEELYGDSSALVDLTGTDARTLIGKPTGSVVFPDDFWGKSSGLEITIGAVSETGVDTGYSNHGAWGYYGTMSPANSRVTPNAAPDANAEDRIVRCVWEVTNVVSIAAAGGLSSIPFTAVVIDGVEYPGDVEGFWSLNGGFPTVFNFSLPDGYANPLDVGTHTVIFI